MRASEHPSQKYELALLANHLKSPGAMEEGVFWSSLHQLLILTRLFNFKEEEVFPDNQAAAMTWADELAEWLLSQKFKLSPDGLSWQNVGQRDSAEPGIDLVPMKLPDVPMKGVFDWPFDSIRSWATQH